MPFVNPGDLSRLEPFPRITGALASGDKLMLSCFGDGARSKSGRVQRSSRIGGPCVRR